MLMTIGAALFVLMMVFALYFCSMYLMYLLWNNKYARKARKDAIEALIRTDRFLRYMEDKYEICSDI